MISVTATNHYDVYYSHSAKCNYTVTTSQRLLGKGAPAKPGQASDLNDMRALRITRRQFYEMTPGNCDMKYMICPGSWYLVLTTYTTHGHITFSRLSTGDQHFSLSPE